MQRHRPGRERGPDLEGPHDDLDDVERARRPDEPEEPLGTGPALRARGSRAARQVATTAPSMMRPTMKATDAMCEVSHLQRRGCGIVGEGRDELAVHQRPVGEDERGRRSR